MACSLYYEKTITKKTEDIKTKKNTKKIKTKKNYGLYEFLAADIHRIPFHEPRTQPRTFVPRTLCRQDHSVSRGPRADRTLCAEDPEPTGSFHEPRTQCRPWMDKTSADRTLP